MKSYHKNPRRITPKQLEQLKANIQELGDLSGIVHDLNTDEIISGNQRSKVIDIDKCEVVITEKYDTPNQQGTVAWGYVIFEGQKLNYRQVRWDERQREKANITANALGGDWDYDILEEQFNKEDLLNWGFEDTDFVTTGSDTDEEIKEDEFSEEDEEVEPRTKFGDIWILGNHRLMCGDSTNKNHVRELVDGNIIDLFITDPPYNVGYIGKTKDALTIKNDKQNDSNYNEFLTKSFKAVYPFVKNGGAFYIWHADSEGWNVRDAIRKSGFMLKQIIIWNKNTIVVGRQDYQWKHEPAAYGWKPGDAHYFIDRRDIATVMEDGTSININAMKKSELKEMLSKILKTGVPTTVINEDKPSRSAEHPTMKPVRLIGQLIRNSSRKGESVLDTFGGSGTTMIACEQLGRKCYMMELDPHYCDVIVQRWEKFTGNKATLLGKEEDNNKKYKNEAM